MLEMALIKKYCLYVLYFMLESVHIAGSTQCTRETFAFTYLAAFDDFLLKGEAISILSNVENKYECASKCSSVVECKSFNFNRQSLICQLNGVVFLDPRGDPSPGTLYYIRNPDCYQSDGSKLLLSNGTSMVEGRMLLPTCRPCQIQLAQLTCHTSPTTMYACKRPSTCAEVKLLSPGSVDGEYWLFPPVYGGHAKVKVYCHAMSGTTPTEYLTLPNTNQGYFPNLEDPYCTGEYFSDKGGGSSSYSKIRIEPETMEVVREDTEFQTGIGKPFGEAVDCYKGHHDVQSACGPRGTFQINMVGTGLILDSEIQWPKGGWQPWAITSKSQDGLVIDLTCGGNCGYCLPDRPVVLHLYPAQEPDASSATLFPCT